MANEPVVNEPVETNTVDDLVNIFNQEDETPVETKEEVDPTLSLDAPVKEEEAEEEEPELKLDEIKEDEPKVDEDEVIVPVKRSEILKKFPTIFKEFPQLEKSYYQSQEYYNTVGSISEAKELVGKVENFQNMENSLLQGEVTTVLKAIEEHDPGAFSKIVNNYLPNLGKVNPQAYFHVVGNVFKDAIQTMAKSAHETKNEDLLAAARILNQFMFQSTDFVPKQEFAGAKNTDTSEAKKLAEERQRFINEKFNDAHSTLQGSIDGKINTAISKFIDPKNVMTDYVKKNASREVFENVEKTISNDTQFRGVLNRLWEKAFQSNFSKDSLSKIEQTYLNKVRTLLPDEIKKSRSIALKGLGRRVSDDSQNNHRRIANSGGNAGSGVKKGPDGKPDLKGMSTLDILNMD